MLLLSGRKRRAIRGLRLGRATEPGERQTASGSSIALLKSHHTDKLGRSQQETVFNAFFLRTAADPEEKPLRTVRSALKLRLR
jgi:hypothetical protein